MIGVVLQFIKMVLLMPLLIILKIYDKKYNPTCALYGIEGYFGLMGQGKTIAMSKRLLDLRKKYGDSIYITTNYYFKGEDFHFEDWHQLLGNFDKPLVVAWDEVQNEFSSRNFKDFPIELLTQLTQVRKNNGILVLYTAQRFARVDKIFRELSCYMYECKTYLGRFTIVKKYDCDDYAQRCNSVSVDNKIKIHPLDSYSFIQRKKHRDCYDSYQMLESAKNKVYMDRTELAQIDFSRL